MQYARQAFQLLDEGQRAIHDVADLSRGSLRIAVTPTFTSYFVVPLVAEFHARYPHITLDIQEMPQEKMEGLLLENELDIGIAFAGGPRQRLFPPRCYRKCWRWLSRTITRWPAKNPSP